MNIPEDKYKWICFRYDRTLMVWDVVSFKWEPCRFILNRAFPSNPVGLLRDKYLSLLSSEEFVCPPSTSYLFAGLKIIRVLIFLKMSAIYSFVKFYYTISQPEEIRWKTTMERKSSYAEMWMCNFALKSGHVTALMPRSFLIPRQSGTHNCWLISCPLQEARK